MECKVKFNLLVAVLFLMGCAQKPVSVADPNQPVTAFGRMVASKMDGDILYAMWDKPCELSAFAGNYPYTYLAMKDKRRLWTSCYSINEQKTVAKLIVQGQREIVLQLGSSRSQQAPQSTSVLSSPQTTQPTNANQVGYAKDSDFEISLYNTQCQIPNYSSQYPYQLNAKKFADGKSINGCYSANQQTKQVTMVSLEGNQIVTLPFAAFEQNPNTSSSASDCGFLCVLGGVVKVLSDSANAAADTAQKYSPPRSTDMRANVVGGSNAPIDLGGKFKGRNCTSTMQGNTIYTNCY